MERASAAGDGQTLDHHKLVMHWQQVLNTLNCNHPPTRKNLLYPGAQQWLLFCFVPLETQSTTLWLEVERVLITRLSFHRQEPIVKAPTSIRAYRSGSQRKITNEKPLQINTWCNKKFIEPLIHDLFTALNDHWASQASQHHLHHKKENHEKQFEYL